MQPVLFDAVGRATSRCALAAKPETFRIDQSTATDFVDDIVYAACGVDLETSFEGHVILSSWFDSEGNLLREIDRYGTRFAFRNPETGEWYRFTDAGPVRLRNPPRKARPS